MLNNFQSLFSIFKKTKTKCLLNKRGCASTSASSWWSSPRKLGQSLLCFVSSWYHPWKPSTCLFPFPTLAVLILAFMPGSGTLSTLPVQDPYFKSGSKSNSWRKSTMMDHPSPHCLINAPRILWNHPILIFICSIFLLKTVVWVCHNGMLTLLVGL